MSDAIRLFQSSLPDSVHRGILNELEAVRGGEMGHELAVLIPSVRSIVEDAVFIAEASRMLGAPAVLDGCMHVHINHHPHASHWHQDNYCEKPWPCPMAILCYFPQDTPPEMGPTQARVDGPQHPAVRRVLATGPAGTCLLMRHDVIHRATANTSGRLRYMLKFLFRSA